MSILIAAIQFIQHEPAFAQVTFISMFAPLGLNWLVAITIAIRMKRIKIGLLWPFMIIIYSLIQVWIDLYSIWTWRVKSWGTRLTIPDPEQSRVLVQLE